MGSRSGSSSVSIMGSGISAGRARADIQAKLERELLIYWFLIRNIQEFY